MVSGVVGRIKADINRGFVGRHTDRILHLRRLQQQGGLTAYQRREIGYLRLFFRVYDNVIQGKQGV